MGDIKKLFIIIGIAVLIVFIVGMVKRNSKEKFEDVTPATPLDPNLKKLVDLWMEHMLYTRLVIVAFLDKSRNLKELLAKLYQNQKDIGGYFGNVFGTGFPPPSDLAFAKGAPMLFHIPGTSVQDTITKLLTEHINIAVKVLTSVKNDNEEKDVDKNIKDFYANGEQFGAYIDMLRNSGNLFKNHMKMHIQSLLNFTMSLLKNKYQDDIKYLDQYTTDGVNMAFDMYFPQKVQF